MKITIHRGTREIGGSCIELQSHHSRILIDYGLPLPQSEKESAEDALIDIKGLHAGEQPTFDAILLSHPHLDHYGLFSYINPKIPVYLSAGCREITKIAHYFGQSSCVLENVKLVKAWEQFTIGDLEITPYLADHSGFDALSYLIKTGDKKLFYSGDFRGHGRKSVVFDKLIENPPKDVDCLILEGTMIGRDEEECQKEEDIEETLVNHFKDSDSLYFIATSSQNIDRLVSIYRACVRSGRIFVIDPYTAYILDKLKPISSNIPQFNWGKNIRIFFVPNSYTEKMAKDKSLFKYAPAKISFDDMIGIKDKIVVKDTYLTRRIFAKKKLMKNSRLIFSMWSGYLPAIEVFWKNQNVPILNIHTSGHASIAELKRLVEALKPKTIIPNHTFYPDRFEEFFGACVRCLNDGENINI